MQQQPELFTQMMEDEMKAIKKKCSQKIHKYQATDENITGRGGLSLFSRYLDSCGILIHLEYLFGILRKSNKGLPIAELFKQVFCFFLDGTSRKLRYFDHLAQDAAYAGTIQTKEDAMASSHTVKRFMKSFPYPMIWLFRQVLLELFIWRLKLQKPEIIILGIDLVILNNDDAQKREEVEPTYKNVKGFGALNMTWDNFIVDSVLRSGKKHSNHGKSVHRMASRVVHKIRNRYGDVPIVLRLDSGYMDQSLFATFEKLKVGYTVSGKLYSDIESVIGKLPYNSWQRYYGKGQVEDKRIWEYVEIGDRRGSWDKFRRMVVYRPMSNEFGQLYLPTTHYCQVIYTNLGMGKRIDALLFEKGYGFMTTPEGVIHSHHGRGDDELVFRYAKDFGGEILPFKRFRPNAVYYYCMLIAFFLFGCFREDVCKDAVAPRAYPTTVRRKIIDIGARIIRHSRYITIRVTKAVCDRLNFDKLWQLSGNAPPIKAV